MNKGWKFIDNKGTFEIDAPHKNSYLYFPLANEAGMMSNITPTLNGDIKTSQNTFFNLPVSAEDLHNTKSNRNFWIFLEGEGAWSAAGTSSRQQANMFNNEAEEKVTLQAGLLWHKVIRENGRLGIKSEITSFVPVGRFKVELMKVIITNTGSEAVNITPTAAIPVYGRSAESVRDHRNVTSLLHRVYVVNEGLEVQPAMTFDERGHKVNQLSYNVYGVEENESTPVGAIPVMEEYIGEGGSLEWPEAVVCNTKNLLKAGDAVDGYETVGALRFNDRRLNPGEAAAYIVAMSVTEDRTSDKAGILEYLNVKSFDAQLEKNIDYWEEKLGKINFSSDDKHFDAWMKWVSLQPILRRIYGCSFMPHHDYGKGGRGWRDLWQDCLALLLMETDTVRTQLLNNFGGVRLDGTNATIIGKGPGEFVADRNNISRVWSDHGVWPFFTTLLYINQSGDLDFLFEQQNYFKDRLVMRSGDIDREWSPDYGNKQRCENGELYSGTILEHILIQNLAAFFNAGEHNNIRMENADWNDAFDMAAQKGETVAFTSFYAGNLIELSKLLLKIRELKGIEQIEVASEIAVLFDTLTDSVEYNASVQRKISDCRKNSLHQLRFNEANDAEDDYLLRYNNPEAKNEHLMQYYKACIHNISGEKVKLDIVEVSEDLRKKGQWLTEHIGRNELVRSKEGFEWFNGYYDNAGEQVEGQKSSGVRMTLTGQVFPIMMGIASKEQIGNAVKAVNKYLYDGKLGSYRLNNNFHELKLDLGRCFGFAFGHKENGAVFSHMAVMYSYALYRQGFVSEGYEVLNSLYNICTDFDKARIYPGIPEYINERGRGMYHYLTGSASWLMLLMLTEVYGVRGNMGNLYIQPKLKKEQFNPEGTATVDTIFAGRPIKLKYSNKQHLDYGQYSIKSVAVNGSSVKFAGGDNAAIIDRESLLALSQDSTNSIEIQLA